MPGLPRSHARCKLMREMTRLCMAMQETRAETGTAGLSAAGTSNAALGVLVVIMSQLSCISGIAIMDFVYFLQPDFSAVTNLLHQGMFLA